MRESTRGGAEPRGCQQQTAGISLSCKKGKLVLGPKTCIENISAQYLCLFIGGLCEPEATSQGKSPQEDG